MTFRSTWRPDQDELLIRDWRRGVATATIAKTVGRSKNAVVGRANRLGLPTHMMATMAGSKLPYRPRPNSRRLTQSDVRAILRSPLTNKELAEKFGMPPSNISAIRSKRTYRDVTL